MLLGMCAHTCCLNTESGFAYSNTLSQLLSEIPKSTGHTHTHTPCLILEHLTYHSDWSHSRAIIHVIHVHMNMSDRVWYMMMMIVIVDDHLAVLGTAALLVRE